MRKDYGKKISFVVKIATAMALSAYLMGTSYQSALAAENPEVYLETQDGKTYYTSEEVDIEKRTEFIIPTNPGDNFDVTIKFTGIKDGDEIVKIFYDYTTDDQTVPNVQSNQDDRSGLLNEIAKKDKIETRTFSIASVKDTISIGIYGNIEVLSITATKQEPKKAENKKTVFTIGDSLVQTYNSSYKPQAGWGQTLKLYFDDSVNFVNHAIGGRSTGNFMRQGRLNETLLEIKPGDICLIEFGHNDAGGVADRHVSVEDYKTFLADVYIKAIRDRGATPILVTVVNQNTWYREKTGFIPSYVDYVQAMKEVAAETGTLLIDLNAYTISYYEELSRKYYWGATTDIIFNTVISGIVDGQYKNGTADTTHTQEYGAKMISAYLSEELSKMNIPGVSEHYVPVALPTSAPSAVAKLSAKPDEKYKFRFVWEEVPGADFYKILVAEVKEEEVITSYTENGEPVTERVYIQGEYEINCLATFCNAVIKMPDPKKYYAVKIVAVNAAGESAESKVLTFIDSDKDKQYPLFESVEAAEKAMRPEATEEDKSAQIEAAEPVEDEKERSYSTYWITLAPIFLLLFVVPALSKKKKKEE